MFLRRHGVLVGVVAGSLLVGAAGLAAASPGSGRPAPAAITPAADPEGFVGVAPTRVLDTRAGDGPIGVATAAPLGPGQEITFALTTAAPNRPTAPVPPNAVSVLLNVTIDKNATADSFITVWPTGQPRPNSSANNATPGQVTPNSIVVPLGANGSVSIFNFTGNVELAVDLAGYTVPLAGSSIQGPPGPQGPQGVQGPPGQRGPAGSAGADYRLGSAASPVPLTTTAAPIATTGALPNSNYVVTASFQSTSDTLLKPFTCTLVVSNGAITGATSITKASLADEAVTLTGVGVGITGATLQCSQSAGGGQITIQQATVVAVAVGSAIP